MERLELNGAWRMRTVGEEEWLPAEVPGSVYADLLAVGRMEDPFWRDNEMAALALMDEDYEYTREFEVAPAFLENDRVLLRCDGLDTLAELSINGRPAGSADNMHRTWEFEVKQLLRPGANSITVRFASPTRFIARRYEEDPIYGSDDAMRGFPHLRKAHCMFGWDWGPRLPDAGIWRDIGLLGITTARLAEVQVRQRHADGKVTLAVESTPEHTAPGAELTMAVKVTGPAGEMFTAGGENAEVVIDDPALWWPHGLGAQPLYTVEVTLRDAGGAELDRWARRIGLRTITVRREKDEWGEGFAHEVNGVTFFAMGADYIPEDNILKRVTPQRTRTLLQDAADANFNAIRVWGGGYYPDDFFFDTCDELGLVVWQDFMFSCAVYDLTEDFDYSIRREAADNIRRLRHHASLGLWCGNNEMEMFILEDRWWYPVYSRKSDYIKMYEYILPALVKQHHPDAFYWPASPSSGGGLDAPNDPNRGDVHYWEVWHGGKPFTDYRNHFFRYASEFGFQSFPSLPTVESFTLPEDRNVFSYVMEKHQRNAAANGKIMNYLSQIYPYPRGFEQVLYASQLLQAQAIQYGVEHWRRHRGRCMGAIIWQLNDCWPVASWASIDYYGRWKALHYYAKRFFAPVLLSCAEEGLLSQQDSVNAEPYPVKKAARLNVSNETLAPFEGEVAWSLRDAGGAVLREGRQAIQVPAQTALWLEELDLSDLELYSQYFAYSLEQGGKPVSDGTVLLCPPKHFAFKDPQLALRREGRRLIVSAGAYARSVEITTTGGDVVLSDNFFDMNGGEKAVEIMRGDAEQFHVRSVYDI